MLVGSQQICSIDLSLALTGKAFVETTAQSKKPWLGSRVLRLV
jgi:hypothetical protein